jgi:hypothetical protein
MDVIKRRRNAKKRRTMRRTPKQTLKEIRKFFAKPQLETILEEKKTTVLSRLPQVLKNLIFDFLHGTPKENMKKMAMEMKVATYRIRKRIDALTYLEFTKIRSESYGGGHLWSLVDKQMEDYLKKEGTHRIATGICDYERRRFSSMGLYPRVYVDNDGNNIMVDDDDCRKCLEDWLGGECHCSFFPIRFNAKVDSIYVKCLCEKKQSDVVDLQPGESVIINGQTIKNSSNQKLRFYCAISY